MEEKRTLNQNAGSLLTWWVEAMGQDDAIDTRVIFRTNEYIDRNNKKAYLLFSFSRDELIEKYIPKEARKNSFMMVNIMGKIADRKGEIDTELRAMLKKLSASVDSRNNAFKIALDDFGKKPEYVARLKVLAELTALQWTIKDIICFRDWGKRY